MTCAALLLLSAMGTAAMVTSTLATPVLVSAPLSHQTLNGVELHYPLAESSGVTHQYFGEMYSNEFESLEISDSPESRDFVQKQNALTRKALDSAPRRDEIKNLFARYSATSVPIPRFHYGKQYVIERNGIHRFSESGEKELLVNVDQVLAQTGSFDLQVDRPSITDFVVSPNQRHLALMIAFNGRDFDAKIYILDLQSKKILKDEVIDDALNYTPVFGTFHSTVAVWTADSSSIVYMKFLTNRDVTGNNNLALAPASQKLFQHVLGSSSKSDVVFFERPEGKPKNEIIQVLPSEVPGHVFVTMFNTFYAPNFFGLLNLQTKEVRYYQATAEHGVDHHFGFLGQKSGELYFRTDRGLNPNQKFQNGAIMKIKWDDFDLKNPVYIADSAKGPIDAAFMAGDHLFITSIRDISHHLEIRDLDGKIVAEPVLPGRGTVNGFSYDPGKNQVYFGYTDYSAPRILLSLDLDSKVLETLHRPALKFDPEKFVVTRSFILARDGSRIPTTEIHLKGADPEKSMPTYLYFYGNLAAAILPSYNATTNKFLAFVEMGGRVVISHVRGGTELGGDWAFAGARLNKMNTMTDIIDTADELVKAGRTTAKQIVLSGRSSAGFASASAMLLSPQSFGMLSTVVPLTDMLRYHEFTCGTRWEIEYGMSSNQEEFNVLKTLSPLHITKPNQVIPPTIIFAAEKDDRVPTHHAMKFAAQLQKNSGHLSPVLFFEEPNASHSARAEGVDELTFATLVLGW